MLHALTKLMEPYTLYLDHHILFKHHRLSCIFHCDDLLCVYFFILQFQCEILYIHHLSSILLGKQAKHVPLILLCVDFVIVNVQALVYCSFKKTGVCQSYEPTNNIII